LLLTSVLVIPLFARAALADVGDSESNYDPGRALRRSGFAMGALLGGAAGTVSGFPNDLAKIGLPQYEAKTGFGAGAGGGMWVGGALRDWFVFGVGLSTASISGQGYRSSGTAFVLHVEGYPLFQSGGAFHDLGIVTEFGAGGRTIVLSKDGSQAASGGSLSVATLGVVYEPIRLGPHFSGGPLVEVTHQFSSSLTATAGILGLRFSFYGGSG
jgi:hypothetical protein